MYISTCHLKPCFSSSGTCFDQKCCCPPGTSGFQCETNTTTTTCEYKNDCDGHYSCDQRGNRICIPGWTGLPDCRVRIWSQPSRDPICHLDPGVCTGLNKQCFLENCCCDPGYYGETCDIQCESRDDCWGHYSCDPQGNRVCNPGWKGWPECRERDWPHAPDPDPQCPTAGCASNRVCFNQQCCCPPGLYGNNCDVACETHFDCGGHYTCSPQGVRVCMPGWKGLPLCLERDWRGEGDDPQCPDGETCEPGYCLRQTCCCPVEGGYILKGSIC